MMRELWLVTAVALAVPVTAVAQDRIGAAPTIRVVERIETGSRRVTRFVVEDLTPAEILRLQVELDRAGYDPRSRTGILDERTRRELTRFQSARGLEICGCVTYETIVALGITPDVVARVEGGSEAAWAYERSYQRTVPIVIYVPSRRHHAFTGPGVVIGHEPAIGAGHRAHSRDRVGRFPSRPGRIDVRPAPPLPPSQPGRRILPGDPGPRATPGGRTRSAPPRP
jgi:hypothetical protein